MLQISQKTPAFFTLLDMNSERHEYFPLYFSKMFEVHPKPEKMQPKPLIHVQFTFCIQYVVNPTVLEHK